MCIYQLTVEERKFQPATADKQISPDVQILKIQPPTPQAGGLDVDVDVYLLMQRSKHKNCV